LERNEKYGRNPRRIVKRFEKYRRKFEMIWKIWNNSMSNSDKIWTI
jgi:hypothetical protein